MDQDLIRSQCHVPPRRQSSRQTKPPAYLEDYERTFPSSKSKQPSNPVSSVPAQTSTGSTAVIHSEPCDPILMEMKQLKEFVMELGQSVKQISSKVNRMCSPRSSWSSEASSPQSLPSPKTYPPLPAITVTDSAAALVQELRDCLQERHEEQAIPGRNSAPCVSRQSTLPPPPPSMIPTPQSQSSVDLNAPLLNPSHCNENVNPSLSRPLLSSQSSHYGHLSAMDGNVHNYVNQFMPSILPVHNSWTDMHQPSSAHPHADRSVMQPPIPPWAIPPPLLGPVYPGFWPPSYMYPSHSSVPLNAPNYQRPPNPPSVPAPMQCSVPPQQVLSFQPSQVVNDPPSVPSTVQPSYAQLCPVSISGNDLAGQNIARPTTHDIQSQSLPAAIPSPSCPVNVSSNVQLLQNNQMSHVSQPLNQYPVSSPQVDLRPRAQMNYAARTSRIEGPSFPYFCEWDPKQFMLKMAIENLLPEDETEEYKFHILLDHLKLDSARNLALAYSHHSQPFTIAWTALQQKYGQPHQLVLREIADIMSLPTIKPGDSQAFSSFAVRIRALVGMLQSWGQGEGAAELACASHVQQLLSKLPPEQVANFVRHSRITQPGESYDLLSFSSWLQEEADCQAIVVQVGTARRSCDQPMRERKLTRQYPPTTTILHGVSNDRVKTAYCPNTSQYSSSYEVKDFWKVACPFCNSNDHHLSRCQEFSQLDLETMRKWIREKQCCWRCGRGHRASQCDLNKGCPKCQGKHLGVLHEVNQKSDSGVFLLSRPSCSHKVLLKVVKVKLSHNGKCMETYAILDDGSERTMLLPQAAQQLGLKGTAESLVLRTVCQDTEILKGANVDFTISTVSRQNYQIQGAFTAHRLALPEQSYPISSLLRQFSNLQGLPLENFSKVQPMLLIGADNPYLLAPVEYVLAHIKDQLQFIPH